MREIRKEQADQRSVLLGVVDQIRRVDDDMRGLRDEMRRMEQRLEARSSAVRNDLEIMLKSELLGRVTHFETLIDEKLERLSDRISALET